MKTVLASSIALVLGVTAGVWLSQSGKISAFADPHSEKNQTTTDSKAPLYWVAPMDPNYRRDKPGLSPMGMDLVPVFEESAGDGEPGLVSISPRVENNLGVRTQLVEKRPFFPEIRTVGNLEFNQNALWQINSRVSGWTETLYVKTEGERVKKGQKLLSLYSPELVKAQEELLNALRLGNKILIRSSKNRLSALGVSQGQIRQLEKTRKVSQNIILYASESGYIAKLGVREGAYISPSTQIIEAGPLTEIWLQAEVFESQAGLVQAGDKAEMRLDSFPGQIWQGEVDYIYPVLDAATRTLKVRLKFANQDERLKPNMYARVKLLAQEQPDALQVPREAVIRSSEFDRLVLVKGDGKFQSVRVVLGREAAGFIEVLEGLREGDKVVTSAQFLLDSESSLTADFSRIGPADRIPETAIAKGVVIKVKNGVLTIKHEPVDTWSWPAMVMDFPVDSSLISDKIVAGRAIEFEMSKQDNQYPITKLTPGALVELNSNDSMPEIDHSKMDYRSTPGMEMDHSKMNHSSTPGMEMDHSKMNHSSTPGMEIDHSKMNHNSMPGMEMDHSKMGHNATPDMEMDHSKMGKPQTEGENLADDDLDWLDLDDEGDQS